MHSKKLASVPVCTACALFGGLCWGFSGTCGQFIMQGKGVDSGWLTSIRMFGAGVILMILVLLFARENLVRLLKNRHDLLVTVAFAFFGIGLSQYSYLTAIKYSNSGTATVLQYLGPVIIMLLVCLQQRRHPTLAESLAVLCALGGTFLLATHGNFSGLAISGRALFWGLLSALGLVFYTMLPAKLLPVYGSLTVTGLGMLIGGIPMLLLQRPWTASIQIDASLVLAIAAIILVGTVMAYTIFIHSVQGIGPARASLFACIEPVAATVFSALWLKTQFGWIDLTGFALIMATVFLMADWKQLRAAHTVPASPKAN